MLNFFILIFVYCLFGFKWNLIDFYSSGIRPDDFISLLLLALSLFYIFKNRSLRKINKMIFYFILFVGWSVFSVIFNTLEGRVEFLPALIFTFRHVEYMVFILVGFYFAEKKYDITPWLKFYVIYALVLFVLQKYYIVPVVSGFTPERAIANTGGPWELAGVSSFLAIYFAFYNKNIKFALLSILILLLTQSRISLLGVTVVFILVALKKKKFPIKYYFYVSTAILFLCVFFIGVQYFSDGSVIDKLSVIDRISNFLSDKTLKFLSDYIGSAPTIKDQLSYQYYGYGGNMNEILSLDGDNSAFIRFYRWILLMKATFDSVSTAMIGLGPSFASVAVDGYFVRIIAETGLVGLFIFLLFMKQVFSSKNLFLKYYFLSLVVTALFIDIFVTYKTMMLFWLMVGYSLKNNKSLTMREANHE